MKKGESEFYFPFHSDRGHLFLSGQSLKYNPRPSFPSFSPTHSSVSYQYSHLLRGFSLMIPAHSTLILLKTYCSYKRLCHKIRHLIIHCLASFSICAVNVFSPVLHYNFSARHHFSCLSASPSAFIKYGHMIGTQRIIYWLTDFSRLIINL